MYERCGRIHQITTDMSEFFRKIRQKCRGALNSRVEFGGEARKICVVVVDFTVDILRSLEKDIHVNIVYENRAYV